MSSINITFVLIPALFTYPPSSGYASFNHVRHRVSTWELYHMHFAWYGVSTHKIYHMHFVCYRVSTHMIYHMHFACYGVSTHNMYYMHIACYIWSIILLIVTEGKDNVIKYLSLSTLFFRHRWFLLEFVSSLLCWVHCNLSCFAICLYPCERISWGFGLQLSIGSWNALPIDMVITRFYNC